jgi:tagatose 6-phosphate kinase
VILVVCLNPALDITHNVEQADWAGVNRPHCVHVRAGGKGVNVARTLRALGADVRLAGLAGGGTGAELAQRLHGSGIALTLTPISGETRRTFTVADESRGQTALFNEPGPAISPGEYAEFLVSYQKAVAEAAVVVLSGSLPGLSAGSYAELIGLARAAGLPTILDTSGAALTLGAAAGPAMVKPNLPELMQATGRSLDPLATDQVTVAARELAETVVVSLGTAGLLGVTQEGSWLARPGAVVRGNATGAGDAVVAGLADGLVRGLDWPQRLAHGAALGAATAAAPAAGEFAQLDYQSQLKLVSVEDLGGSPPENVAERPRSSGSR